MVLGGVLNELGLIGGEYRQMALAGLIPFIFS